MSKQAEADLILKLYDLRREETMRKARDWFFAEFHPDSADYITKQMFGPHSGHMRMVNSYWEMAAALVKHGAISPDLFNDTNGEHYVVFCKIEPFLAELRAMFGPTLFSSLEWLIDTTPDGRARLAATRERLKFMRAQMAAATTSA